jgi:NAD(P)-dependent dehydrogenase (short-subunit alcohol dehydrogenase family)
MPSTSKVAFITGGNRGIGFETAKQLGKTGIVIIVGSRDAKKGEAAAAKLRADGISAQSLRFDVTKAEDRKAAYEFINSNFGKLDILINNAAIQKEADTATMRLMPTSEVPPELLREIFDANFFAPVALTQTLLPLIRKSQAGRIVNLSSGLASLTLHSDPNSPFYNFKSLAYDSSKTALNSFTVHLAHELRDTQIKVNSADPGWVKTDMGGPNAPLELSEGGKTSVQLATLPADGPTGGFFHLGDRVPW